MDSSRKNTNVLINIMCNYIRHKHRELLQKHSPGRHPRRTYIKLYQELMLPVVRVKKLPDSIVDSYPLCSEVRSESELTNQLNTSAEATPVLRNIDTNGIRMEDIRSPKPKLSRCTDIENSLASTVKNGVVFRSCRFGKFKHLQAEKQLKSAKVSERLQSRARQAALKLLKRGKYVQSKSLLACGGTKRKRPNQLVKRKPPDRSEAGESREALTLRKRIDGERCTENEASHSTPAATDEATSDFPALCLNKACLIGSQPSDGAHEEIVLGKHNSDGAEKKNAQNDISPSEGQRVLTRYTSKPESYNGFCISFSSVSHKETRSNDEESILPVVCDNSKRNVENLIECRSNSSFESSNAASIKGSFEHVEHDQVSAKSCTCVPQETVDSNKAGDFSASLKYGSVLERYYQLQHLRQQKESTEAYNERDVILDILDMMKDSVENAVKSSLPTDTLSGGTENFDFSNCNESSSKSANDLDVCRADTVNDRPEASSLNVTDIQEDELIKKIGCRPSQDTSGTNCQVSLDDAVRSTVEFILCTICAEDFMLSTSETNLTTTRSGRVIGMTVLESNSESSELHCAAVASHQGTDSKDPTEEAQHRPLNSMSKCIKDRPEFGADAEMKPNFHGNLESDKQLLGAGKKPNQICSGLNSEQHHDEQSSMPNKNDSPKVQEQVPSTGSNDVTANDQFSRLYNEFFTKINLIPKKYKNTCGGLELANSTSEPQHKRVDADHKSQSLQFTPNAKRILPFCDNVTTSGTDSMSPLSSEMNNGNALSDETKPDNACSSLAETGPAIKANKRSHRLGAGIEGDRSNTSSGDNKCDDHSAISFENDTVSKKQNTTSNHGVPTFTNVDPDRKPTDRSLNDVCSQVGRTFKSKVKRRKRKFRFTRKKVRTKSNNTPENSKQPKQETSHNSLDSGNKSKPKRQEKRKSETSANQTSEKRIKLYPRRASVFYASDLSPERLMERRIPKRKYTKRTQKEMHSTTKGEVNDSNSQKVASGQQPSKECSKHDQTVLEKRKSNLKNGKGKKQVQSKNIQPPKPINSKPLKKRECFSGNSKKMGKQHHVKKKKTGKLEKKGVGSTEVSDADSEIKILEVVSLANYVRPELPYDGSNTSSPETANQTTANESLDCDRQTSEMSKPDSNDLEGIDLAKSDVGTGNEPLDLSVRAATDSPLDLSMKPNAYASQPYDGHNDGTPKQSKQTVSAYACFNIPRPPKTSASTALASFPLELSSCDVAPVSSVIDTDLHMRYNNQHLEEVGSKRVRNSVASKEDCTAQLTSSLNNAFLCHANTAHKHDSSEKLQIPYNNHTKQFSPRAFINMGSERLVAEQTGNHTIPGSIVPERHPEVSVSGVMPRRVLQSANENPAQILLINNNPEVPVQNALTPPMTSSSATLVMRAAPAMQKQQVQTVHPQLLCQTPIYQAVGAGRAENVVKKSVPMHTTTNTQLLPSQLSTPSYPPQYRTSAGPHRYSTNYTSPVHYQQNEPSYVAAAAARMQGTASHNVRSNQACPSSAQQPTSTTMLYKNGTFGGTDSNTVALPRKRTSQSTFCVTCDVCRKKAVFLCSACKRVAYCSNQCQYLAWNDHKKQCYMI